MTGPAETSTPALREHIVGAIAELRDIRSTDPAAARALLATRLAAHTLETFWLPALDDPQGDDGR